jgi:AraC-like DNA-binding protein
VRRRIATGRVNSGGVIVLPDSTLNMSNDRTARPAAGSAAAATVRVQRIVDLIEKIYAQRVTLDTLAMALRAKPQPLARLFRDVVGQSVHAYLTRVRLEHAAHLVRAGIKIEAVALAVGYRSKKNFYRQFTRHYGVTPEAYRRGGGIPKPPASPQALVRSGNGAGGGVTYSAKFDHTACVIDVEARPNVKGRPSYVATPFVIVEHGMQPFATTSDHVEIAGTSEADALERAAIFLEHRFGSRAAAPRRVDNGKRVRSILVPRP